MKQIIFKIIKILSIIAGVIAVLGVAAILVFDNWLGNLQENRYKESKFDREIWLKAEKDYHPEPDVYIIDSSCIRGKMWDDLRKNYLKKGNNLEEVLDLLGSTSQKRIYSSKKRKMVCLQYDLGGCGIMSGPEHILLICPDKNNKIIDFFISDVNDSGQEKRLN